MSVQAAGARSWSDYLPSQNTVQSGLLVLTVATSILSNIPGQRINGAIALRCVSLCSATLNALDSPRKNRTDLIFKCTKVACVILGLTGLTMATPAFTLVPLAIDMLLQFIQAFRSASKNELPAFLHFGMALIEVYLCFSLLFAREAFFGMLVFTLLLNSAYMLSIALVCANKPRTPLNLIDIACYVALSLLNIVTIRTLFSYEPSNYEIIRWDRVLSGSIFSHATKLIPVYRESLTNPPPLPIRLYPTIPIGGTAIVTRELS